jgi:hypothetical protein
MPAASDVFSFSTTWLTLAGEFGAMEPHFVPEARARTVRAPFALNVTSMAAFEIRHVGCAWAKPAAARTIGKSFTIMVRPPSRQQHLLAVVKALPDLSHVVLGFIFVLD